METTYAPTNHGQHHHQQQQQQHQQQQTGDADEMQHMWQYLDATLASGSTPNGLAPPLASPPPLAPPPHSHAASSSNRHMHNPMMPAAMTEGDAPPLTEDDNGMYNELGDVFNMFFNLDSDEQSQAVAAAAAQGGGSGGGMPPHPPGGPPPQGLDPSTGGRVQLSRHASAGSVSFSDGISPGLGIGYPSMSPATMNWLQSLSKSPSSESLSGLISPATMSFSGSANGLGGMENGSTPNGLPRSPSCELIDWKAYNDACGIAEKTQKEQPKWRVIPQHGPHADTISSAGGAGGGYPMPNGTGMARLPPGSAGAPMAPMAAADAMAPPPPPPPSRSLFTRQFQTIKSTVGALVGVLSPTPGQDPNSQIQSPTQNQMYYSQQQSQAQGQALAPPVPLPSGIQQQYELAVQRMADEKNKRKAIISPEYVQYGASTSTTNELLLEPVKFEPSAVPYVATQVHDPTGRRPSKKSLHFAGGGGGGGAAQEEEEDHDHHDHHHHREQLSSVKEETSTPTPSGPVRCKCTGKCRNARCACVKAGLVCGVHCKCVSCANPFVPMQSAGIDLSKMVDDICLMQFLSKVKDMEELLQSFVSYECCQSGSGSATVQVKETVENGFTCPKCQAHFKYSWCSNRLCHDQKKPRKHCDKCRRCGDHRNEHCDECNHCYFAGVANSFSCSCKANNGNGNSHNSHSNGHESGGGGGKSRSMPNHGGGAAVSGDEASSSPAHRHKGQGGGGSGGQRSDENANPQHSNSNGNRSNGAGPQNMAAGLSSQGTSEENEKDDACPVQ